MPTRKINKKYNGYKVINIHPDISEEERKKIDREAAKMLYEMYLERKKKESMST